MNRICPNCGRTVAASEILPLDHSPGADAARLQGCAVCRAKLELAGHHQQPFEARPGQPRTQHAAVQQRAAALRGGAA